MERWRTLTVVVVIVIGGLLGWSIGITHNFRHDPDRLPGIVGPVGVLSALGCVGLLVAWFVVG
jgi:hypothetical protein